MGPGAEVKVRYWYRGPAVTPSLARHAFRYVAAMTGIAFREDEASPDICYMPAGEIPVSAKIIIADSKSFLGSGGAEREVLGFDPIREIADALSLSFISGPYAPSKLSPSPANQPTLSETITAFVNALADVGLVRPGGRAITLWPEPHPFALALTHDIDIVRRTIPGSVRLLWKRHLPGGLGALLDSARSGFAGFPNPYDRIREWIGLEKGLGLKSTFFVFDGWRRHANDPKYKLSWISRDLDAIKSAGFELALHTGIGCHEGNHIPESKKILEGAGGGAVHGLRPHYLSASYPQYWRAAAESGFAYSSAFGFDEEIGFLRGIDLPIIPFDRAADEPLDIVEIPIAIMDCGLAGMGNGGSDEVFERGAKLIDRSAQSGGLVVLDWHERTLYKRDYPGWGGLYFRLVEHARARGAYVPLMSDIAANVRGRFKGRP